MADQIVIAELQINTKALQESNTKLIQQIAQLKSEQKDLQTSTNNLSTASEEQSRKFIENDVALKSLNAEYSNNKKVLSETTTGIAGLNDTINKEVKTVSEATKNNRDLLTIRNQINSSTEHGAESIAEINSKIDKNNELIKGNVSELEKQKMNIGNYKDSIKGALAELNPFNGGLSGFMERSQAAGGTGKLLTESFSGIMTGVKGATMAAWEFIATPIGAIIAAIVVVATLLYDIFKNFAPVINPIKDAMAALGAVFEVVKSSIFALVTGTKSLGEVFSSFGSEASKAADDAMKLAQAQRDVVKAGRELELSTAKAQAEITKLMTQSKNRTLSEEERMGMLNKAIKLEEESVKKQLKVNNDKIANARLTLAEGKEISEEDMEQLAKGNANYAQSIKKKYNLDQGYIDDLRKLQVERYGIEEASSRVIEKANNFNDRLADNKEKKEQKATEDAKKAQEDAEKAQEKAIQKREQQVNKEIELMKSELSIYTATQNLKNKSLYEEIKVTQTISDKKLEILNKELANKKISQANYDESVILLQQETYKRQTDLILANSKAELDLFISENVTKLDSKKLLTQALIDEERKRLESIKLDKLNLVEQEKQTNQQIIDEKFASNEELSIQDKEYLTAKNNLEEEYRKQNKTNQDTFDEQVKQQKASQLQADNEIALADSQTNLDSHLLQIQQSYDAEVEALKVKLQKQQITQDQFDAKKTIAKKKMDDANKLADLNDTQSKLNEYKKLGEGLAGLFGKNKLIASALAGVNTALGVTEILKTPSVLPEPIASISRAVQIGTTIATGVKSIAEINGAKFKDGIIDIDGPGTGTSDSIPAMISKGESVITASATAKNKDLLHAINTDTLGKNYSIPFTPITTNSFQSNYSNNSNQSIDYDLLASKIGDHVGVNVMNGVKELPVPTLPLEDFHKANNNYAKIINGANH